MELTIASQCDDAVYTSAYFLADLAPSSADIDIEFPFTPMQLGQSYTFDFSLFTGLETLSSFIARIHFPPNLLSHSCVDLQNLHLLYFTFSSDELVITGAVNDEQIYGSVPLIRCIFTPSMEGHGQIIGVIDHINFRSGFELQNVTITAGAGEIKVGSGSFIPTHLSYVSAITSRDCVGHIYVGDIVCCNQWIPGNFILKNS